MAVSDSTPLGARFSRLEVVSAPLKNQYGIARVRCRCDCGNEKDVNCADLRDGKTTSCGCGRKDIGKRKIERSQITGVFDGVRAGDRFGRLSFRSAVGQDPHGRILGEFQCDCGAIATKPIYLVRNGHTKSCGCASTWNNGIVPTIGEKWGRLTVVEDARRGNKGKAIVTAECDCGTRRQYVLSDLRKGNTKSCGCLKADGTTAHATHGHTRNRMHSRTYRAYHAMISRCTNPKSERWDQYGGRGIAICERWLESFENFLADMGECPTDRTLDRKKVDGNYEPNNCRWATDEEQMNNTQRSHFLEFNGERLTVAQWARRLNVPVNTLYSRLKKQGWSIEKTLTTPSRVGRNQFS
jgi:hypothetical protein